MKEGKVMMMPFRRCGIVCLTTTIMATITCFFVLDVETVFSWARMTAEFGSYAKSAPDRVSVNMSGHDDPSCLARTQHLLYRRHPEQYAPSPAFKRAWDRYEMMHKACSYKKNWTHVFLYERNKTVDHCNYLIVMEGSGGLGNKLLSLTSAFAYALATDRVVLVDGRKQFKDLLCDPFRESSWFLPPDFPYQNVTDGEHGVNVAIAKNFTDVSMVLLRLDHIQVPCFIP